jgi:RNA-binding protein
MKLTGKQIKYLSGLAHHLKPVVIVGNAGLTDTVIEEINRSLDRHELIKIKISADDRDARSSIIDSICTRTNAVLVQRVGNMASVFRRNPEKIRIPLGKDVC